MPRRRVICAAISPYRATREEARKMVGENFIEVYMDTPSKSAKSAT
jgi:adenylylsulfate kinase-like enzyme